MRDDGWWYVRILSEHGGTLGVSRGYMLERGAKRAQHRLNEIPAPAGDLAVVSDIAERGHVVVLHSPARTCPTTMISAGS